MPRSDHVNVSGRSRNGATLPEATFRQLVESSPNMVSRLTADGRWRYVSPACEQVVGWAPEELIGRHIDELCHPDDVAELQAAYAEVLRISQSRTLVYRFRHRDGSFIWTESTAREVHDQRLLELQVSTRDVTSRVEMEEQLRRSDSLHRTLTANLPDTAVFLFDHDLRIVLADGDAVAKLPWVDEQMFRGRRLADLHGEIPAHLLGSLIENYEAALRGEVRRFEVPDDGYTFAVDAVPVAGRGGQVEFALGVVRDVTERKEVEQQLVERARKQEDLGRQQEAVARLGQKALVERDLSALAQDVVRTVADTLDVELCAVLERHDGEHDTLRVLAVVGSEEDGQANLEVHGTPGSHAAYVLDRDQPVILADLATETRFEQDPSLRDHGIVSGMSVVIQGRDRPFGVLDAFTSERRRFSNDDVNFLVAVANLLSAAVQRHHEEQASRHAALHDALTGLPNRTLALDRLAQALGRQRRTGSDVAVLMLDLDRFKVINDSLGHRAGDEILLALAPRLAETVRATDTVARLSGDEFVVVCESTRGVSDVVAVADRIAAAVARPFRLDSGEHFLTASIGIAVATGVADTPQSLLRDADVAMYRAKHRGPGRYELFDADMRAHVLNRLRVETELRQALASDQLCVHYQPIVDVVTGTPIGTEALVRWEHPERGLLGPLEFISIAEETGLVIELGRWVIEQACAQGAAWQREFGRPLQMSVNVSGRQLANPLFATEAADIARRSGLLPGTLELEVTESVLIEDAEAAMAVLERLHAHGLRLVLDDFGTGYSSLSYLKRFPLDGLKIDRSFTSGLGSDPVDTAIVRSVVELADAVGMAVVAEGVEDESQLEYLRRLGCAQVQGYLFSRPVDAHQMTRFLEDRLAAVSSAEMDR